MPDPSRERPGESQGASAEAAALAVSKALFARWGAALAWAGLIFYLSSRPSLPGPSIPFADKIFHAAEFGILTLLLGRAIAATYPAHSARKAWKSALLLAVLYAVSDEIHQAFVPGRTCDILDAAADLAGAAVVFMVAFSRFPRTPRGKGPH